MSDLEAVHQTFIKWLGQEYDLMALDAVLFTAATRWLDGDPPWLQVVSGSGAAKTETVIPLVGADAFVIGSISGEAALLSGTPAKERAKDATGGLLRKIGDNGLLVVKDFTSVLSMSRDARAKVLAALREIHDGHWVRDLGTEGGRTLTWSGRIVLIGACTTAFDTAREVIAVMGDRFAIVRIDSSTGRTAAGRQALRNVGHEEQMRKELARSVKDLMATLDADGAILTESEVDQLLDVADLVTLIRTAVDFDYKADVVDAHAPEMPTRFAKMLGQVMRGGLALGVDRDRALGVALRVAHDSIPPFRLALLGAVTASSDGATLTQAQRAVQRPTMTVSRGLQALHVLGLLEQREDRSYEVSDRVDLGVLKRLLTINGNNRFWDFSIERQGSEEGCLPNMGSSAQQQPLPFLGDPERGSAEQ